MCEGMSCVRTHNKRVGMHVCVCVCEEVEGLSGAPHGMSVQTADTKKVPKKRKRRRLICLRVMH